MSYEREVIDGERARALLEDETFKALFDAVEKDYILAWRRTDPFETEGRERLYIALHVLDHVRTHLRVMAESGQLAIAQLEKLKRIKAG